MNPRFTLRGLFGLVAVLLLSACGNQQAGYQITDRHNSLAVTREQQHPWSDWTNRVVVSFFPACQRRYPLQESPDMAFAMDVYRVSLQVYVLNHNNRWYITEVPTCRWQEFEAKPPQPGELIGTFKIKDENLIWEANPDLKKNEAGTVAGATGAPAAQ